MPRTPTLPLTEPTMWRELLARTHPDAGGSHELFIWTRVLKDVVCGGELRIQPKPEPSEHPSRRRAGSTWYPTQGDDKPRISYPTGADFEEVTRAALRLVDDGNAYAGVLSLLVDCYPIEHLAYEQERGASYKRLAAIAHTWGMSKAERTGWYRVAEGIPLSDRHAGHILSKLKRQAA
jgi:hypothetical protein